MEYPNTSDDLDDLVGCELPSSQTGYVYTFEAKLGAGRQAVAFRARRRAAGVDDLVVLKVFRPSFVAKQPEVAELARQKETLALARIGQRVPPCPFVVRLLDGGELSVRMGFHVYPLPWLALEHVEGGALGTTLRERVLQCVERSGTAFGPARARKVIGCIVQGVQAIHDAGIVHRDLKPTNVLVCGAGQDELAKVADFGVARQDGVSGTFGDFTIGTPGYAAPEQLEHTDVGPWSDVFSLAALTYYVLTGEDMFAGSRAMQLANVYAGKTRSLSAAKHLEPSMRREGPQNELQKILEKSVHPKRGERPPTVQSFWAAVEPVLRDLSSRSVATLETQRTEGKDDQGRTWTFRLVHQPIEQLSLTAVCFDPDGLAIGAGESGLRFWEGAAWRPLAAPAGLEPRAILAIHRFGPSRWFACGESGLVAAFSPERTEWRQYIAERALRLNAAHVLGERTFALTGRPYGGTTPVLLACLDGQWAQPVPVPQARSIDSLTLGGITRWHGVGTASDGSALMVYYDASRGRVDTWSIASPPLAAVASDGTGRAFAVGDGGHAVVRGGSEQPVVEQTGTQRGLTAVSVDPSSGDVWAAGRGRIVRRHADTGVWSVLWSSGEVDENFVAIGTFPGLVVAATTAGHVVVGRRTLRGAPTLPG